MEFPLTQAQLVEVQDMTLAGYTLDRNGQWEYTGSVLFSKTVAISNYLTSVITMSLRAA